MFVTLLSVFFLMAGIMLFENAKNTRAKALALIKAAKYKPATKGPVRKEAEKPEDRTQFLQKLSVPQNFPTKLHLYFGSQSGTAEKFC